MLSVVRDASEWRKESVAAIKDCPRAANISRHVRVKSLRWNLKPTEASCRSSVVAQPHHKISLSRCAVVDNSARTCIVESAGAPGTIAPVRERMGISQVGAQAVVTCGVLITTPPVKTWVLVSLKK